jgi:hypothetical protein
MRKPSQLLFLVLILTTFSLRADAPLKSGLQPGQTLPNSFDPVNLTGEYAGQPHCLVCENGNNPVVMIFAKKPTAALKKLITQLDQAAEKHRKESLGAFVVFLADRDESAKQLEPLISKPPKHLILSAFDPPGPEGYAISDQAEVTVVLYTRAKVKVNHAYRAGELNDKAIDQILADLPQILPAK